MRRLTLEFEFNYMLGHSYSNNWELYRKRWSGWEKEQCTNWNAKIMKIHEFWSIDKIRLSMNWEFISLVFFFFFHEPSMCFFIGSITLNKGRWNELILVGKSICCNWIFIWCIFQRKTIVVSHKYNYNMLHMLRLCWS